MVLEGLPAAVLTPERSSHGECMFMFSLGREAECRHGFHPRVNLLERGAFSWRSRWCSQ